ncbi:MULTISPECIES: helix-turn-helix transcriptional regulator [Clavibacter]|jgi:putative transcriptional regulator|uniref:Transcriptional regulator n=1 Tax=Clavibacter michiganensis subsp. insidiosus TaxID=33014 RepID=A0A0D5CJB6_9MICO|nr:helix-turn-helix transcriptional regulator [Clavibacter michiganensis]AJW79733.1 hypothetical protein VO01_11895 [Clavibacter michiganensis subsp. insidiosus]MBT1636152.1 helix-turn-helix transcriptional regulator [Clavibacter michiganensis]OQJ59268.1 transcriptional regulator [Clavibacter michiganensis subsp. insidiosus]RII87046.1 transcriptional regulator [Clavibacter michiganensis subsp. insidiosus]RIJ44353.1 transcriptional regulator [Clavibacter michiganensis subsp. insidiosus]
MKRGERVHEARSALGLTQQRLAEKVGVSRRTIISIETGRHEPSLSLAFRLAAVFGESVDALFAEDVG